MCLWCTVKLRLGGSSHDFCAGEYCGACFSECITLSTVQPMERSLIATVDCAAHGESQHALQSVIIGASHRDEL